jgi:outer membrane receptor protein involved in Fe transport
VRLSKRLVITPGARLDHWRNYDAQQTTRSLTRTGTSPVVRFAERGETAFSPQLSALYKLSQSVSLNATFSRAFRAEAFRMDVTRPVANVTLSVTPALITRRRQNLGRTPVLTLGPPVFVRVG